MCAAQAPQRTRAERVSLIMLGGQLTRSLFLCAGMDSATHYWARTMPLQHAQHKQPWWAAVLLQGLAVISRVSSKGELGQCWTALVCMMRRQAWLAWAPYADASAHVCRSWYICMIGHERCLAHLRSTPPLPLLLAPLNMCQSGANMTVSV